MSEGQVAEDMLNIEIDGVAMKARKGAMIIEIADQAGVSIPRFCYHKKLSIAANCRMCLVEVEKAPKPMPACATPVMDGMKVFTRSDKAMASQRAVMEFLLINHPLDCPICDQGGECELQDLALGYGSSISRFSEKKRVVMDKNLGPLIATDMTRCIHCTRCIRFVEEIAGYKEMGALGRGENLEIGTYIEKSIESEMSGNVIDVCPVGALTSKPFRFTARAWELSRHASVAPHDAVGSNIDMHCRRGEVMRVVPRENEEVNEVWISDRDRFSYQGLYSDDRLLQPMVKVDGEWQEVDWEEALNAAINGLRGVVDAKGVEQLGLLSSPTATLEEMFLLRRLADGLGCTNIDHRLRQVDFVDQDRAPIFPWLGQKLQDFDQIDSALIIGSDLRKDQPIVAHRLRKAINNGAQINFLNPVAFDFHDGAVQGITAAPAKMVEQLAGIAASVLALEGVTAPVELAAILASAQIEESHRSIAKQLTDSKKATVLLGNLATANPAFSTLRSLAALICERSGACLGYLGEAANSTGAWLAGVLPHRSPGGSSQSVSGLNAKEMLDKPRAGYVLFGLEPEYDCWDGVAASQALNQADLVVSITSYVTDAMRQYADVLLPLAGFAETSGTYINSEGRWQSFSGAGTPPGAARPGWKILRVMGNLLELPEFKYNSSEQVRDALKERIGEITPNNELQYGDVTASQDGAAMERLGSVPIYAVDPLVRRASALQQTADGQNATVRICRLDAEQSNLLDASFVSVQQGDCSASLVLEIDDRVPPGCAWIPVACTASVALGASFGAVQLKQAERS